jgi:hypothetical protein
VVEHQKWNLVIQTVLAELLAMEMQAEVIRLNTAAAEVVVMAV